jgi:hypothetical protein
MNADGIKTVLTLGMQTRETPVDHRRFNLSNNPYCPASKPGDCVLGGNAGMWTSSLICPAWSEWLSHVRDAVADEREKRHWMERLCIHEVKEGLNIIEIDSLQDWETLVKIFPDNRSPNPATPKNEIKPCPDFETIGRAGYDAIHVTQRGAAETRDVNGWDCESTLWVSLTKNPMRFRNCVTPVSPSTLP